MDSQKWIRDRYKSPKHQDGIHQVPALSAISRSINFRHPGYSDAQNILLTLPALDGYSGRVSYEMAHSACAVIANNAFDGCFSLTRDGDPNDTSNDGILCNGNYYYRFPGDENRHDEKPYPIVPSFDHWAFPHADLPTGSEYGFKTGRRFPDYTTLEAATRARDVSCRVTDHALGTEVAWLVPKCELPWFERTQMSSCACGGGSAGSAIESPQNTVLLRSDIRNMMDQGRIVIVHKKKRYVVQALPPVSSAELVWLYHNVEVQPLYGVSRQCLFASFARAIFKMLSDFLLQGSTRRLILRNDDNDNKGTVAVYSKEDCLQLLAVKAKKRTTESRKRPRRNSAVDENEEGIKDSTGEEVVSLKT